VSAIYGFPGVAKAKAFDREGRKGLAKIAENTALERLFAHRCF
jgi:hypothetical protein